VALSWPLIAASMPLNVALAVASASQDLPKTTECVNANATVNVTGGAPPLGRGEEPRAAH
jgi:hypothetical protein